MPETGTGFGPIVIAIVRSSWEVLLLRSGPQVFPRSHVVLYGAMLAYLGCDAFVDWVQGYDLISVALQSVLETCMWVVAYTVLLAVKAALPRLDQTLTAWFGASTLIILIFLPIAIAGRFLTAPVAQIPILLLELLLLAWTMLVMAHLLRHALRIDLAFGFVIGAVFVWADQQILSTTFAQ